MEESCVNCKFWDGTKSEDGPQMCLRFPPQVFAGKLVSHDCTWPDTAPDDWCGEWKTKDEMP